MKNSIIRHFEDLPLCEKVLVLLVPVFSWGGIGVSYILSNFGFTKDPGSFVWGCVLASFSLGILALLRPKKDIVSIFTPAYAIIIFFSLEIPPSIILQILFAATLTILLWRLEARFSTLVSIQHA